jgi:hypothetical protein
LLRRSPGVSPDFPTPFRVPEDSRACCIPLPIVGFGAFLPKRHRVAAGPVPAVIADVAHRRTPRSRLPRTVCSYPPEDSPDPQPHSVTTAVALPDLALSPSSAVPMPPLPASSILPPPEGCLSLRALLRGAVRTGAHR